MIESTLYFAKNINERILDIQKLNVTNIGVKMRVSFEIHIYIYMCGCGRIMSKKGQVYKANFIYTPSKNVANSYDFPAKWSICQIVCIG